MTAVEALFAGAIIVFCTLALSTCASCVVETSPSWACECVQAQARGNEAVCTERVCKPAKDAGE